VCWCLVLVLPYFFALLMEVKKLQMFLKQKVLIVLLDINHACILMPCIFRACIFLGGLKCIMVEYLSFEYLNSKHFKHIFISKNSIIHIYLHISLPKYSN